MQQQPNILVVDDEESIRKTLTAVLEDEGFKGTTAKDGEDALGKLEGVDLVLLDIWMPGMDGIEVLERIKETHPELPVVMISGHATIATAMQATKKGAADFIEKPLELEATIKVVKRVLGISEDEDEKQPTTEDSPKEDWIFEERVAINRAPFENTGWRGKPMLQKTLKHSAVLYGHGVHSGRKSGLMLEPLGPNCGIHFAAVASAQAVPAHLDYVTSTGYATTIKDGENSVATIEHLMSALHAYGITNLLIKCNGEVPVMDGSALEFCKLIEQIGIEEQTDKGDFYEIEIPEVIQIGKGPEFIRLEPADKFSIDYTLQYPDPIGRQFISFVLDPKDFKEQIAPARTFGFVKDIGSLQRMGLAQGGRFDNFVLVGEGGIINADLRFPDEAARHKVLDMIGDLYLLGRFIKGKVTACMTGHSDNIELLKKCRELMSGDNASNMG